MKRIRVLLAEHNDAVRSRLHTLLHSQPDIKIVCQATNGREAVARAREVCPDVAVLDLMLPGMDGVETTRQIRNGSCATEVVILTTCQDEAHFFRCLKAGAAGYVSKSAAVDDLIHAVRTVARGGAALGPDMTRKLLNRLSDCLDAVSGPGPSDCRVLSDREREIVLLIARGLTNQEIAGKLFISPKTVKIHCSHVMQKLNLGSMEDLVRYALRQGSVDHYTLVPQLGGMP